MSEQECSSPLDSHDPRLLRQAVDAAGDRTWLLGDGVSYGYAAALERVLRGGAPPGSVRGFVLIARTAGLVVHLAEEAENLVGMPLWQEVERRAPE